MATTTTNYGLTKPSYGDNADIAVINSNMDKIDAKMKEIEDADGGASTWAEVVNKPFETVGSGLSVDESGALNATGGGSGGSSVSWNQIQTSGSKIAEVTIDGTKTDVYAPTGGSGGGGETGILVLTPTQFENLSPLPESGIIGVTSSDSSTIIKKFYDMSKYVDIEYDENVWNGISVVSYVNTGSDNDLIHEDTVSGYNVFCVLAENVLSSNYTKYDTLTVDSIEQMPDRCVSNTICISSAYFSSNSGAYKATSHSEGNNWNNQAIIFAKVPWNNCEFVQDYIAVAGEKGCVEYVADKSGYYLIPITAGGQSAHSITVETDGFKKELKSTHSNGRYADLFGVFLRFGQKLKITYTVARNTTSYVYCGIYYVK